MARPDPQETETKSESIIAVLLVSGVVSAAAIVLVGAAIYLYRHGLATPEYRLFRGEPSDLRSIGGIISEAKAFHGRGIIQLGLIVLIATPVTRVAYSVLMFIRERDRLYILITIFVLCLLIYSLLGVPQ